MMQSPRCVCVETPLRGDTARRVLYADACMLDCLERGEAPFLGHLLYPRVLDDANVDHRARGIEAHLAWLRRADYVVIYTDLGVTSGMRDALALAVSISLPFQYRQLASFAHGDWEQRAAAISGTARFLVSS